jgi:hypothetical protein
MSSGSYTSKGLRATLILPQSNFPGTGSNTITLVGYRMIANIQGAARFPNSLDLTIFGMQPSDMNALTILWGSVTNTVTGLNARALIKLEASNDGVAWTQVFEGTFSQAQPDYRNPPNAALHAQAWTGNGMQIQSAPPTSYPGVGTLAPSVVSIAQYLAGQMGFTLEPNGVTGTISTPYYPGTLMDQFRALCHDANLDFYFDGNGTLAIVPANQPRQGKAIPVLSPTSGLRGFPTIQQYGLHADALWQPALTLGGQIQITGSIVPSANGIWTPYSITHDLESLNPDGAWFSAMDCYPGVVAT